MERFLEGSLGALLREYLSSFETESENSSWLERYQHYVEKLKSSNELSSDDLEELWCRQKSAVALIRQGVTPLKEFERAKSHLAEITKLVAKGITEQRYTQAIELMTQLSEQKLISRRYFSVLHRMIVAFDSERLTFPVDEKVMLKLVQLFNDRYDLAIPTKDRNWYQLSSDLKQKLSSYLPENADPLKVNIAIWRINEDKDSLLNGHLVKKQSLNTPSTCESHIMTFPLNQILYGPPGTGKTYHTIEAAVKAAEPSFSWHSREELKAEYDRLVSDKRIRFVTFHQSYGYEEFVEGLRAVSNQDNQIEYPIQSGIFKQICQDATASAINQPATLKPSAKIWKLSIDGVKSSRVRDYCFANNLAAIGWGNTGDMSSEERTAEEQDYFESLGALAKSSIMEFSNRMAEGDIVVCVKGQWSIQAVGVVSGDYQFREEGVEDRSDFCHVMPVDWLATGLDVNLYELNDNTRLTLKTCYELTRFTSIELYEVLEKSGVKLKNYSQADNNPEKHRNKQNYVLVIDEINRGNISKVFGELITLIEPSKRKGQEEALELTLPYSGKPFSVPDNLYIIGTMNTADRSLAMMDTALRRRFDFVEMMPKPELLEGVVVKGIDLQRLLKVLNQRIEILYDREHTLGHAFLMPVKALVEQDKQALAFSELQSVFQNKIIPLLEEYFFEDWSKIRLVLADNQKSQEKQFIKEHTHTKQDLTALFGVKHNLDQYGQSVVKYTLADKADEVWCDAESYIGIYSKISKTSDENQEFETSRQMVTE